MSEIFFINDEFTLSIIAQLMLISVYFYYKVSTQALM